MTRLTDAASEPRFPYELLMPHATDPESGLDARRRRIKFRAWHRGMLEMDLIMGRFVEVELARLDEAELDDLEKLLEPPDRDVLAWVTGEIATPRDYDTPVFRKICAFFGKKSA
jgi:antitoxin CptB